MNAITNFAFEESLVRMIEKDGEPWFVGKDVCGCLGLKNHNDALTSLDNDEKGVATTDPLGVGGAQNAVIVSEPGVYRLIFRSRKPEAERFKRWLAHEVIPAIRKTGQYGEPRQTMRADIPDVDPDASLSARVGAVRVATRLYGKHAGRALWEELGLPRLVEEPVERDPARDAAALEVILAHRPNDSRPIREWLADALAGDVDCCEALPPYGVKASPDTGGFYIGQSHPKMRALFRGTPWANGSWVAALKRLAGGHHGGRVFFAGLNRFEGYQSRVIWLPASTLEASNHARSHV